jgi:glycyl-tRNA synthetase
LPPKLAPIKAAIFPIVKNKEEFVEFSREIYQSLKKEWNVTYDESGSIGRRYARNDEIGTPYCITIDGESLDGKDVTIRDRDTTKQIRVKASELKKVLRNLINEEVDFEKAFQMR